jgi:aldehyde dehydrogenase (NAD+)
VIERVRDIDEAVDRANGGRFGLGAAVFSRSRGEEIAGRLRSGMVAINSVLSSIGMPMLPFGGVGDSGFGRVHGADGLREFTRTQAVARLRYRIPLNPLTFDRSSRTMRRIVRLARMLRGR